MADSISEIKSSGGRLFLLDLEEVQDMLVMLFVILENIKFRMLYAIDNVSELTARVNDDGWDTSYSNWLKVSKFSQMMDFIFSVGGGNLEKGSVLIL